MTVIILSPLLALFAWHVGRWAVGVIKGRRF